MTKGEAWFTHAATLAVGVTGVVYAWMRYFATPADPFAVVNHPWQPFVLHAHVVTAPLLVFAVGMIWRAHVWERVRSGFKARRRTGILLFALVLPMIASGYLLQVAEGERAREVWLVVHVATSALWVLGYPAHQLSPRRRRAAGARRS